MKRGNPQNNRYWLLIHAMADGLRPKDENNNPVQYSAKAWHLYCRTRWLGCDDVTMPNGKTESVPRSSAELDKQEFSDYMTAVEAWACEHGIFLADMGE